MLKGDKLLIIERKELQGHKTFLLQRNTADDNETLNRRKIIEHTLLVVVKDKCGDVVLFDICLKRQGIEGSEDEIGVFKIDIECMGILLLQVVEDECGFAAASGSKKVDIPLRRDGCFAQYKMVVEGRMFMILFE